MFEPSYHLNILDSIYLFDRYSNEIIMDMETATIICGCNFCFITFVSLVSFDL